MYQKEQTIASNNKSNFFTSLNEKQKEAVEHTEGPLLVVAGAGTGKTGVLTYRIANILLQKKAFPSQILAVTFTNKAANEMKERVSKITNNGAEGLWLGTFHSIAAKILRKHITSLGFEDNFTIIDADDQLRLLKKIIIEHNIDEKKNPAKALAAIINRLKDKGLTPEKAKKHENFFFGDRVPINVLYEHYQARLSSLNALDFGDLLLHNLTLFTEHSDILDSYNNKFKYILVDEYQDTNIAQYLWLRLLSQKNKNICCVGDDDQSIYSWRGAEVGNILRFEKDFNNAKIIRLERNYRSTAHILEAASAIIGHNSERLGKKLWTEGNKGTPIKIVQLYDQNAEANFIANEITSHKINNQNLQDIAILVRTSFQTRIFEEYFIIRNIPYKIIGGLRFYERAEIKDAISYIKIIVNNNDSLAFERIINTPKRGIGAATLDSLVNYATLYNISLFKAAQEVITNNTLRGKVATTLEQLLNNIKSWQQLFNDMNLAKAVQQILEHSGYLDSYRNEKSLEAQGKVDNLNEFIRSLNNFSNVHEFIEYVALVAEREQNDVSEKVNIMTLHAAKGLEFTTVFLPGWEEGIFPNQRALTDNKAKNALEEERRLAYVGLTRAKENAYICFANRRLVFNQWQDSIPSCFIKELPAENITFINGNYHNSLRQENQNTNKIKFTRTKLPEKQYINTNNKSNALRPGKQVFHPKFGNGVIIKVVDNKLSIAFDKAGMKTIMADYVQLV